MYSTKVYTMFHPQSEGVNQIAISAEIIQRGEPKHLVFPKIIWNKDRGESKCDILKYIYTLNERAVNQK